MKLFSNHLVTFSLCFIFAVQAEAGGKCETLLFGTDNQVYADWFAAFLADRLKNDAVIAIGSFATIGEMYRKFQVPGDVIRRRAGALHTVLDTSGRSSALSPLRRISERLTRTARDCEKLTFCLISQGSLVRGEEVSHVFSSREMDIVDTARDNRHSVSWNFPGEEFPPDQIPVPVQAIIILAPGGLKPEDEVGSALTLVKNLVYFDVTSILHEWLMQNRDAVRRGETDGLFAYFKESPIDDRLTVSQGFAQTLMEAQGSLAWIDIAERAVQTRLPLLGSSPPADREQKLQKKKSVRNLIVNLKKIDATNKFISKHGLNEYNIMEWSRSTIEELKRGTE